MKYLMAAMVSFIALVLCTPATAQTSQQSIEINGFSDGTATISGDIKAQIITNIVNPIKATLSRMPNDKITISLVGCASQDGTEVRNYAIGKERADGVKSVLQEQLPAEQFSNLSILEPYSNGAEAKARMVKVTLVVFTPHPKVPLQKRNSWTAVIALLATLILLATVVLVARRRKPQQITPDENLENVVSIAHPHTAPQKEKVRIITNERGEYFVTLLYMDGAEGLGWYTPFPAPNNFRVKKGPAKNAAKNSLDFLLSEPEIEKLIAVRHIEKIRIKGVA